MSQSGGKEYPNPLRHEKGGPTVFDVGAAYKLWNETEKEEALLLQDMIQQGIVLPGSPSPTGVPPRASIHVPTMPEMGVDEVKAGPPGPGMGDLHTQQTDPGQNYWTTHDMARALPGETPVAKMRRQPDAPPGVTPDQRLFFERYLPQILDRALRESEKRLKCGTYFVQPQPHLAPPPTAIPIDVFTSASGIELLAADASAREIIRVDFPDRFFGVIDRFGFVVQDHLDFASITLSMQRDQAPLRSYGSFNLQLGKVEEPTKLGSPLLFGSNQKFRVIGSTIADTTIFMRAQGWAWATRQDTNDGSFKVLHTS